MKTLSAIGAAVLMLISIADARDNRPLAPYSIAGSWCAPGISEIAMKITREGELFLPRNICHIKKITPKNDAWWLVQWVCKDNTSLSEHLRTVSVLNGDRQLESRTAPTGHGHLITYDDCGE